MSHPRLWPRVMSRFTAILQLGSVLKSVAQGPNGGHERADPSGMVTGELVLPLTGHLSRTAVPTPSTGPMAWALESSPGGTVSPHHQPM